ncbi:sodium-dependent serotonin transporter-like [Haliotis rufescens]|uniref:sodium-dependent serotonin transporter-like n=1 Tax=Haliotis rufescens TaxID=6454 RepID=UPI00201E7EFE|nr:sodium-dependent serotonin transporter-like [Haliotis rufescens]
MPLNANLSFTEASGDPFTGGVSKLDSEENGGVVELCRSNTDLLQDRDREIHKSSHVNRGFSVSDVSLANQSSRLLLNTRGLVNETRPAVKGRGVPRMTQPNVALLPHGEKRADDTDLENGEKRDTWGKKMDFLLSVIGFAVDLGNVWRFPYICYRNGGGAFLLPYLIMLVFLGIPLFYMELALGQFQRTGIITVWKRICPMFSGVGFGVCIIATLVGSYYNTVIAWGMLYLVSSFRAEVPWKGCNNSWNSPNCVSLANNDNITNTSVTAATEYFLKEILEFQWSDGVGSVGNIKWSLTLCLLAIFIVIYFCLWKGVKSSGKAVWVTATLPYIILFILLIRGCTLPGASKGIYYFIKPDFSRLLTVDVWVDAAAQIFFSLGPGFGTLMALASYNKFHNNCFLDAMITPVINCLTSFLAGFVVFAVLGYMAHLQNVEVDQVAAQSDGPGLVFIAYPEAIATFAGSPAWAVFFFLMLITLGLDSSFGGLESSITAITDQFPKLRKRRELVVLAQLVLCFIIGLPTTTYGGQYIIQLMDTHAAPISLIFICFIEAVAVNWIYGVQRFSSDIQTMLGSPPGMFWKVCWVGICPLSLLTLFVLSIIGYQGVRLGTYIYPPWAVALGWCLTSMSLLCIPVFMVYWFLTSKGTMKQKCLRMVKPVEYPTHVNRTLSDSESKYSSPQSFDTEELPSSQVGGNCIESAA